MSDVAALFDRGGPVMYAILALSVLVYTRCFHLLLTLRRRAGELRRAQRDGRWTVRMLRDRQGEVREFFSRQRLVLGSLIAAAPLLGLLGTVNGMMKTFGSLGDGGGQKSMEGLAHGISEVLVATESGLAVAIPALLLVYVGHRLAGRQVQTLVGWEQALRREGRG
ncbi:MAG TPA: MotA/TolQ/ExbB proton channel family protein [Candidatus Didemnitutus sp.]|nr:MotA/TolQ/ExbB proton channel family protein [Candidatus Didemnitutus sp.]